MNNVSQSTQTKTQGISFVTLNFKNLPESLSFPSCVEFIGVGLYILGIEIYSYELGAYATIKNIQLKRILTLKIIIAIQLSNRKFKFWQKVKMI